MGSLWPMAYMVDAVIRLRSMFRFRLPGGWRSVVLYILNLTWNIPDWTERIGRKYSQQCQGWLPGLCLATPWLYYYTFALISFCRDLIFYYKEGCVGLPQLCLPDWWVMSVIGQGWGIILIALSGCCCNNWSKFGVGGAGRGVIRSDICPGRLTLSSTQWMGNIQLHWQHSSSRLIVQSITDCTEHYIIAHGNKSPS